MSKENDKSPLRTQIHHGASDIPWWPILSVGAILIAGAGIIYAPQQAGNESAAPAAQITAETAPDETLCSRQTWPYIDQRCAQRVNAARDTRQVRIVTDKGTSVTAVTPVPVVEPKAKQESQKPALAQNDRPIGPPVSPAADAVPQEEVAANAPPPAPAPSPMSATATPAKQPAPPLAATNAMAQDNRNFTREASVAPSPASSAPAADGVDAFDNPRPQKSKAARAAEKREKREAKRRQKMEQINSDVPDEVVAAVRAAPSVERSNRRGRSGVPAEVVAEVERAAAAIEGRGSTVVVGSPSGRRVYIVPRDVDSGSW